MPTLCSRLRLLRHSPALPLRLSLDGTDLFGTDIPSPTFVDACSISRPTVLSSPGLSASRRRCSRRPAWVQLSSDVDGSANDLFGSVVSIAAGGGSFVAGGPGNDLARVYESLPSWQQQGDDLEGAEGSGFGSAVSMAGDGDTVVVGAPEAGDGGRAYIYAWASNAWTGLAVDE